MGLIRPDGTHRRRLPCTTGSFADCDDHGAVFSPDGSRLAVVNFREIVIVRPDGRVLRRIPVRASKVAWSPDGRRLAYTAIYEDPAAPTPHVRHAVYMLSLRDPRRRQTIVTDIDPWALSWSARGQLAWEKIGRGRGIYVSDPRGRNRRRIVRTTGRAHVPRWSHDGRRLAYNCGWHWCSRRADGSDRRLLAPRCTPEGSDLGALAWSPDGTRVACMGRRGDLIVVTLGTREYRVLARDPNSPLVPDEVSSWQVSRYSAGLPLSR